MSELINALLPQTESIDGQIVGVILKKGELRILSDQALGNAFELLSEGTPLEDARLIVESIPVRVSCPSCRYEGAADHASDETFHLSIPILSCPNCQSRVDVLAGRELFVDRLTVHRPTETDSE